MDERLNLLACAAPHVKVKPIAAYCAPVMSAAKIAIRLSEMAVPSKGDYDPSIRIFKHRNVWSGGMVNNLLHNEAYAGISR